MDTKINNQTSTFTQKIDFLEAEQFESIADTFNARLKHSSEFYAAVHEAGHVFIAWYWRRHISGVTIIPENDWLGRTSHAGWTLDERFPCAIQDMEIEIDILLAGEAAEQKYFGNNRMLGMTWGTDYEKAAKIAKRMAIQANQPKDYVEDIEDYIIDSQSELISFQFEFFEEYGWNVERLMERPHIWSCIETLAEKLFEKKKLSGAEAVNIISDQWEKMDGDKKEEKYEEENQKFGWGYYKKENPLPFDLEKVLSLNDSINIENPVPCDTTGNTGIID